MSEARLHRRPLGTLLRSFGWIGLTSLGQGRAAYFHDELVRKHKWATDHEFLEGLTVGTVMPGPNVTNLSVYFGQRLGGVAGALLGTCAVVLPGALLIFLLGLLYFSGLPASFTGPVGRGIGAAAVGLVAATFWRTGERTLRRRRGLAVAAVVFALLGPLGLNLFLVLIAAAPISVAIAWPRQAGEREA
jgi:chromate transporter